MEKNNKVVLDLVEHAHELKTAGIDSFALVRAGLFIACLYAHDLQWKPKKLCDLLNHIYFKMLGAINGEFFQRGTETEQ